MALLGYLKVRRRWALGRGELKASGSSEKVAPCALLSLFWSSKYFSRYYTTEGSCQLFLVACHATFDLSTVQPRAKQNLWEC